MKKSIVALLLCITMAAAVTGCDKKTDDSTETGTEITEGTETGISSASIQYTAKDYVKLGQYTGLEVTLDQNYEVTEDTVRDYVNNTMIANNPFLKDTDKDTVETGDVVNLDYTGTKDGEEFAGGSAQGYNLEIGSHSFIDGFEDGMIGMKVGEEKDLNLTFPENYSNSDLAGAAVVFHVKVNKIQAKEEVTYDTFTDEYTQYYAANNNMDYTDAKTLLNDVKLYLEGTAANQKASAVSSKVLPILLENCTVDKFPDNLYDAMLAETLDKYQTAYGTQYGTLENIAKSVFNLEYDEFEKQVESDVEQNLKIELILEAIADKEGIELNETNFRTYVQKLMSQNEFEKESDLYLTYGANEEEGKAALQKEYLRIQALSYVVNEAKVTVQTDTETETPTETESATETK